jgi:hypothetical protein
VCTFKFKQQGPDGDDVDCLQVHKSEKFLFFVRKDDHFDLVKMIKHHFTCCKVFMDKHDGVLPLPKDGPRRPVSGITLLKVVIHQVDI